MINELYIINGVFNRLGESGVVSVEDDDRATLIQQAIIYSLREIASKADWYFLKAYDVLAKTTNTDPTLDWKYEYQLPVDLVKIVRLPDWLFQYERIGTKILTNDNSEQIGLYYIKLDKNNIPYANFTEQFSKALIDKIAEKVAYPLTQDMNIYQLMLEEAKMSLADAINHNEFEQPQYSRPNNPYERRST